MASTNTNDQRAAPPAAPFGYRATPPPSPFGGTLGVIAIAFGIGVLGAYALDLHSHACACGHKWRHLGAFNFGDLDAHTCKNCGTTQWWKDGWHNPIGSKATDGAFRPMTPLPPPRYVLAAQQRRLEGSLW